jgi:hypothetical protein
MFCSNPSCPDRYLRGPASDYREDVRSCPVCGSPLQSVAPKRTFAPTTKDLQNKKLPYWREYRSRRRALLTVFLAAFAMLVISSNLEQAYPALGNYPIIGAIVFYVVAGLLTGHRLSRWPCPRCHQPFHSVSGIAKSPFSRSCAHCGLPLWHAADRDRDV